MKNLSLAAALAVTGIACHSPDGKGRSTQPQEASVVAARVSPLDAATEFDGGSSAASPGVPALFPVVEGACPKARAYSVGKTPVLVVNRDAWAMGGSAPYPLYRMGPVVFDRV